MTPNSRLLVAVCAALMMLCFGPVAVQARSGGAPGAGYVWTDSVSPDAGVTFDWIDVSASGTKLTPVSSCDDCVQQGVDIGFDFPFYGAAQRTVAVGANGSLMFGNTSTQWGPADIPATDFGNAMLPFWSDWDLGARGDVYAGPVSWSGAGGQPAFAIEWKDAESWDCDRGSPATWEVILIADGRFAFQYLDATLEDHICDLGRDMTVAIQKDALSCYEAYSNQEAIIADRTAILWSPAHDACSGGAVATSTSTVTPTQSPPDPSETPQASATAEPQSTSVPTFTPAAGATPPPGDVPVPAGAAATTGDDGRTPQGVLGSNRRPDSRSIGELGSGTRGGGARDAWAAITFGLAGLALVGAGGSMAYRQRKIPSNRTRPRANRQ